MDVIEQALDSQSAWVGLLVLIGLFVLFISEKLPPVIIAVIGAAAMLILGYLPREDMEQVFANPAPITIAAMFVLSGALIRTGVVEALASAAERRAEGRPTRSIGEVLGGAFFASSIVNNTPVVIVLVPIMRRIAAVAGTTAQRLLIPLSYLSIMGGTLTLIGTSTNLLVDGVAQRAGQPAFGIFELTAVGLVAASAGMILMLLTGWFLLPKRSKEDMDPRPVEERFLSELAIDEYHPDLGKFYAETGEFARSGIRPIALKRGGELIRHGIDRLLVEVGDRLVLAADEAELLSLEETYGLGVGVANRPLPPAETDRIVTASIAPTHPAIGRNLSQIPFLTRTNARVLGLMRSRHMPGPTLGEIKLRAADNLLIKGGPACIAAIEANVNLIAIEEAEVRPYRRLRAPIAVGTMLSIVTLAALGVWTIELLAIVGVAVVLATRCIDPEEAWKAIDGNVIVLIFGMLGVGVGLQKAGTVDLIVEAVLPFLTSASPLLLLILIYALTSVLTELVTNNAVAVIMTPIVLTLAEQLGIDPRPLLFTVMFAASASFATPIGYQTNTIVYAAGGYRFADFLKIGLPMNIVVGLVTCWAIDRMV
ncbi:MAG: SLC13 family permease [Parasphingopyxis sp.]|uniref:SLC13 family permease n=1 Tax=Parasphingopyxis sp. TaxID=1920299 RepID=UPI003F9ED2F8